MKIWKYPSSAALLINCCWSALDHGLCLNNIALNMIWGFVHRFILKKVFLCHCQMLNITLMNFDDSSSDSFFAPSWSGYYLFSFLGSTVLPRWSTSQGVLRRVDVISCQGFHKLNECSFLFDNLSCSRIKSHNFKGHVYSTLIVEMKSEMSLFEKPFWKSSFFIKDPTHVIRNTQSFDCLVFWKTEMTRCKI